MSSSQIQSQPLDILILERLAQYGVDVNFNAVLTLIAVVKTVEKLEQALTDADRAATTVKQNPWLVGILETACIVKSFKIVWELPLLQAVSGDEIIKIEPLRPEPVAEPAAVRKRRGVAYALRFRSFMSDSEVERSTKTDSGSDSEFRVVPSALKSDAVPARKSRAMDMRAGARGKILSTAGEDWSGISKRPKRLPPTPTMPETSGEKKRQRTGKPAVEKNAKPKKVAKPRKKASAPVAKSSKPVSDKDTQIDSAVFAADKAKNIELNRQILQSLGLRPCND